MIADFLRRFWVCLALLVPVILLSMMFRNLTGYQVDFPFRGLVVLVLATVIYGYGGWPLLTGMVGELRSRKLGMMTLVAIAVTLFLTPSQCTGICCQNVLTRSGAIF